VGSVGRADDVNTHGSETSPLADNRLLSSANPVEVQVLSSARRGFAGNFARAAAFLVNVQSTNVLFPGNARDVERLEPLLEQQLGR
jgi:hypothetical protein